MSIDSGTDLASLLTLDEFEREAQKAMSHMAFEYVAGGAGAEITVQDNRSAFDRLKLLPRVLINVSRIDTELTLFGRKYAYPVLLAPVGYQKLAHPAGEIEAVQGANVAEATFVAATFSNAPIEEIAAAAERPPWFQVYIQTDRGFTKELIERAVSAGCEAVCVTADVPVNGPRDRELRAGFQLPPGVERANLKKLGTLMTTAAHRPSGRNIYSATHGPDATWKDIEWLRSLTAVKLLVKGVLHPDDAELAIKTGCDGVIVSNHGGRSIDTVPATIDALPRVVERIADRAAVLVDGGVRRGIDLFKALALGADAILIGRPYVYGLAVGGAAGVARVLEIIRTELEMSMGLMGCTSLRQITPDCIWRTGANYPGPNPAAP